MLNVLEMTLFFLLFVCQFQESCCLFVCLFVFVLFVVVRWSSIINTYGCGCIPPYTYDITYDSNGTIHSYLRIYSL